MFRALFLIHLVNSQPAQKKSDEQMQPVEQAIEHAIASTVTFGVWEWGILLACCILSAIPALAIAVRDRLYRDIPHLYSIGFVGGALGLGCCCLVAHVRGGVGGNELLLFAVAPLTGMFGRYLEKPITKKLQSILGI